MKSSVVFGNKVSVNDLGVCVWLVQAAGDESPSKVTEIKITSKK